VDALKIEDLDTKSKILVVAKKEFATNGYDSTSIRDITNKAGVNVSAINYHFGSKEDLFLAIVKDVSEKFRVLSEQLKPAESTEDFKEKLHNYFHQSIEFGLKEIDGLTVFFREQDRIWYQYLEVATQNFLQVRKNFIDFLTEAMKKDLIQNRNAEVFSNIFFNNMKSEFTECVPKKLIQIPSILDEEYRKEWTKDSFEILWNALKK
jgi:AcrR family transcriptional regulator